jgi:hypothetical protein
MDLVSYFRSDPIGFLQSHWLSLKIFSWAGSIYRAMFMAASFAQHEGKSCFVYIIVSYIFTTDT